MPTVIRFAGLRIVIYPNDHRPAHVHVIGRGCEVVFNLNCSAGPAELRENYGFRKREIREIQASLSERMTELCAAWRSIHERA
jgi:hypothetical protein